MFPPGVTQVKGFFLGEGRGGLFLCSLLFYMFKVIILLQCTSFPGILFRVFQHFFPTTFNTHKHMAQPTIVYFNSYNPSCGGYFMVELFSKSTISVQYDYFDT